MNTTKQIQSGEHNFEISADEKDLIIIERQFTGRTKLDTEIDDTPIPQKPVWLNLAVRLIRYYQRKISPQLGNRCVFDPSCSHYAELAFRKKGFIKGVYLTTKRLYRCRAKNGGTDTLP